MRLLVFWPVLFLETFLPGWLLLCGLGARDDSERILLAAPTSALVMGLFGLLGLALGWTPETAAWTALTAPLLAGFVLAAARHRPILPQRREHYALLLFWFGCTSLLLALTTRIPAYLGGGWYNDWLLSYQLSQWYGQHGRPEAIFFDVYSPISRPPLFYIVNGLCLARWYGIFDLYQWSATAWSSTLLFGAWAWVRQRPRRPRWWALAALPLVPAMVHNLLYPWPKGMAAGFVLLALYYFRRWDEKADTRAGWTSAALFGTAYFCHQLTVAYMAGVGFYLVVVQWRRLSRRRVLGALAGLAVILAVSLPWWTWSVRTYGFKKTVEASPVVARVVDRTGYDMTVTRAYNLAGLVLPENTRRVLSHRPLAPRSCLPGWMEALQAVWRGTLWGNLGLASLALLAWLAMRRRLRRVDAWPGWGTALFVIAFAVAVQPLREHGGMAQVALLPLAVLGFVWTTELFAARLSRTEWTVWVVLLVIEFLVACPILIRQLIEARTAGRLAREPSVYHLYEYASYARPAMVVAGAGVVVLAGLLWAAWQQKAVDKAR